MTPLSAQEHSDLTSRRLVRREKERASRRRRLHKVETLRGNVVSLERGALALRVVSDADAIWDAFLDLDAQHVRGLLRALAHATQQVKQLTQEQSQLQRLLTERELARRAIARDLARLTAPTHRDDAMAKARVAWHTLSRLYWRAWTSVESMCEITAAMASLDAFIASPFKQHSGINLLGWRDSSLRVEGSNQTHVCFEKRFRQYDLAHHVALLWRVYTDEALYATVVLGGKARVLIDVLQQLSPTTKLVRYVKTFLHIPLQIHALYLLFSVTTATSVTHYMKTVAAGPDLERAVNDPTAMWASNSFWMRWELVAPETTTDRTCCDYRMYAGGTRHDEAPDALARWKIEMLHILLRAESAALGRPLLDFS